MKHQKLIATLLGVSAISYTISQPNSNSNNSNIVSGKSQKGGAERIPKNISLNSEKEISIEIPINSFTNLLIDNDNRPIEIKTWSESKVKISTISTLQGNKNNLLLLEDMNIHTKIIGNSLTVKTGALNNSTNNNSQDAAIGQNNWAYERDASIKKVVTIYVPKEIKLSIESKYSDVSIPDYLLKLNINITNGSLELGNINSLSLRSKYANVAINEVQNGEIDFINGKLSIQNLGEVELDTKYSTVEIGSAKKVNFKSTNDEYELDDVAIIEGSKNYGNLRISKLTESIQLDGTNADVKIKNIGLQTKSIWIDNKYADLRIPLKNIKNFSLTYDGTYSTIYKNFAVSATVFNSSENTNTLEDSKITTGDLQNSKLKAIVGSGKDFKITLKCQNCTVDFK